MLKEIPTAAAMEQFGGILANQCSPGTHIFLQGQLGAGKTTLVRGFLHGLGYAGIVKSPTYTLVEPYFLPEITVYHFDLYRVNDPGELESIGLRDYFDPGAVCLIEWPEKAIGHLGKPDITIKIDMSTPGRKLLITAHNQAGENTVQLLK